MSFKEFREFDNRKCFDIHIYSEDRIAGSNVSCEFSLKNSNVQNIMGKPCYISISSIEAPMNSVYQITTGNQYFAFSIDGTSTISFLIAPGSYTVTSLCAYLKAQMESLDGVTNTYDFGYNLDQNQITITPTFSTGLLQIRSTLNDSRINEMLGLDPTNNLTISISGTVTSFPYQCNMNPLYYWFLNCDLVQNKNIISSQTDMNIQNSLFKLISLNRFTRTVQWISDKDYNLCYCSNFRPNFKMWFIDQYGKIPQLDQNLEWSCSLRVFPLE